ncbi:hypothetical protein, partial [Haemophilus parainfluenzae]|uniref:hypothetical protein n=1 Tax=Haemophilus parainfluenzae TaxID=729 RepID=UPI001CED922B
GLPGDTGNVTLNAPTITLSGNGQSSAIFSTLSASMGGTPTPGSITVTADTLNVTNTAINSMTFGTGDSGPVQINASNAINLNNGSIFSRVNSGTGNSGGISIATGSLN